MLKQYLEELKKIPLLTREEEALLWARSEAGEAEAHQKLITSYQPLVFKLAMGFRLQDGVTMELIQEGTIGLLEAAESFDHTRGVAFSLFAAHRIRGRMVDFLKGECAQSCVSLDTENEAGLALVDFLPSDWLGPAELAERHVVAQQVAGAVERLPQKEKEVLEGLFWENCSIADLADRINVSTGHVYRLQKQGVRRIRGMLSRFMNEFNKS